LLVKILRIILDGFWVEVFIVGLWKAKSAVAYTHKAEIHLCECVDRWGWMVATRDKYLPGFIAYSVKTV